MSGASSNRRGTSGGSERAREAAQQAVAATALDELMQEGHIGMIEQSSCTFAGRIQHRTRKAALGQQ